MRLNKTRLFQKNAKIHTDKLDKIDVIIKKELRKMMNELETTDGKILSNDENMTKILLFETKLKKIIDDAGYNELANDFIADVPKLIKKIK